MPQSTKDKPPAVNQCVNKNIENNNSNNLIKKKKHKKKKNNVFKSNNNTNISNISKNIDVDDIVGVDLNQEYFVVLSDSTKYPYPKHLEKYKNILETLNNINNYTKTEFGIDISKQPSIIDLLNIIRKEQINFIESITSILLNKHKILVIEHFFESQYKEIMDMSNVHKIFYEDLYCLFCEKIKIKANKKKKQVIEAYEGFPSTIKCSNCGYKNEILAKKYKKQWVCPECSITHNRDLNAAINLKNYGEEIIKNKIKS